MLRFRARHSVPRTVAQALETFLLARFLLLPNLSAAGVTATLTLAWDPSAGQSVVGYRVYQGSESQIYTNVVDVGNMTSVDISDLIVTRTYYFAVTAYDSTGLESEFSGEISYVVPDSAPKPPVTSPPLSILQTVSGQALLTGTGSAGAVYDIWASTDFSSWVVVGSVTVDSTGWFRFTDPSSPALRTRFYVVRQTNPPP